MTNRKYQMPYIFIKKRKLNKQSSLISRIRLDFKINQNKIEKKKNLKIVFKNNKNAFKKSKLSNLENKKSIKPGKKFLVKLQKKKI